MTLHGHMLIKQITYSLKLKTNKHAVHAHFAGGSMLCSGEGQRQKINTLPSKNSLSRGRDDFAHR